MLIKCNAVDHAYLIKDDPVRPKLFRDNSVRFEDPFHVYAEINDETGEIAAVVCTIICKFVPQDEYQIKLVAMGKTKQIEEQLQEREEMYGELGTVLCPYSIWSYQKGHGRKLINNLLEATSVMHPNVDAVITMSPDTDTAMRFHTNNGADVFAANSECVNYEYEVPDVILH
tara:strand:+ start:87 stop:602 length:516 start_codon:yes stop_codon:yes gene_type:complete